MDESFDKRTLLLSALTEGVGQLASGRTRRGLVLLALGKFFGIRGGVVGLLLRLLTFGRQPIPGIPYRLNRLAVVWLAIYLYNLYDAYNIASGADEDDADLLDYDEYAPAGADDGYVVAGAVAGAGAGATALSGHPTGASDSGRAVTSGAEARQAAPSADTQAAAEDEKQAVPAAEADQDMAAADEEQAVPVAEADQDTAAADEEQAVPSVEADQDTGEQDSSPAEGREGSTGGRSMDFGDLDWQAGVQKAQLMEVLGSDEQVLGVFGQYLPSDRVFHSADEVMDLIPTQAWQSAQGRNWTGGTMGSSEDSGYRDSPAAQPISADGEDSTS